MTDQTHIERTEPAAQDGTRFDHRTQQAASRPFDTPRPIALTTRQQEVLDLLAQGYSNKEIARALETSPKTVEFHLGQIFRKLNVTCRIQAVLRARASNSSKD